MLQRIYELVANSQNEIHDSRNEIRDLKETINNQQAPIQQLTTELQNITQQLEEFRNGPALGECGVCFGASMPPIACGDTIVRDTYNKTAKMAIATMAPNRGMVIPYFE
ncbi:hypothetical protein PG991_009361 [Apiospora marii]|uniref:Uncharacterized protein n=1 Tax=Apiospora marii TaxID=335849 RepID=A0ABR1RKQ8_9PEZI